MTRDFDAELKELYAMISQSEDNLRRLRELVERVLTAQKHDDDTRSE